MLPLVEIVRPVPIGKNHAHDTSQRSHLPPVPHANPVRRRRSAVKFPRRQTNFAYKYPRSARITSTVRHSLAACVVESLHVTVIVSASANIGDDTLPSDLLFTCFRKHTTFTGTEVSNVTADSTPKKPLKWFHSHVLCQTQLASVERLLRRLRQLRECRAGSNLGSPIRPGPKRRQRVTSSLFCNLSVQVFRESTHLAVTTDFGVRDRLDHLSADVSCGPVTLVGLLPEIEHYRRGRLNHLTCRW